MTIPRRSLPALLALPALAQQALAQPRAVRLVVPYAPGGTNDVTARLLAQRMGEALGQTCIVENRSGASGASSASTSFGDRAALGRTGFPGPDAK